MKINEVTDTLKLPSISVGDEIRVGKFKNRKAEVTGFDKDEHNQPVLKTTKGDQKLFKPRISKLVIDESYKLQLERDDELLVLNITDIKTGKRTEVRGKPGYETGGYDENDPLHKLLDKIGKTANISELINGEPVSINPKHPDADRAKAATDKAYNEAFVKPQFDVEWEEANRYPFLDKLGQQGWEELAKTGKAVTVTKNSVKKIGNTGADGSETLDDLEPEKVARLKKAMKSGTVEMPIVMKQPNGELELIAGNTRLIGLISAVGKATVWYIDASKLEENFADGKVKGKSRPGRVKRAGASCNGSVTDLRKRAKNASGEKAKMYHWCANMKAGKK